MSPGTLNAQIPEDGLIEAGDETEREGRGWRGDRESGRVRQRSQKDTDARDRQKTGKGQRIGAEKGEVVGKGENMALEKMLMHKPVGRMLTTGL